MRHQQNSLDLTESRTMKITQVTQDDFQEWQALAQALWPDCTAEDLLEILQSPRQAAFLARSEAGIAIGFMNLALRYDYVPDASQSPVAFIEGIYMDEAYRQQGMGRALIQYAAYIPQVAQMADNKAGHG
jgi:aminoglycoside 6'-N-acetyltransferase I